VAGWHVPGIPVPVVPPVVTPPVPAAALDPPPLLDAPATPPPEVAAPPVPWLPPEPLAPPAAVAPPLPLLPPLLCVPPVPIEPPFPVEPPLVDAAPGAPPDPSTALLDAPHPARTSPAITPKTSARFESGFILLLLSFNSNNGRGSPPIEIRIGTSVVVLTGSVRYVNFTPLLVGRQVGSCRFERGRVYPETGTPLAGSLRSPPPTSHLHSPPHLRDCREPQSSVWHLPRNRHHGGGPPETTARLLVAPTLRNASSLRSQTRLWTSESTATTWRSLRPTRPPRPRPLTHPGATCAIARWFQCAIGTRAARSHGNTEPLTRLSCLAIVYRMPVRRRLRGGTT
jgi:hypothetical protein